jgi:hypothetical protein
MENARWVKDRFYVGIDDEMCVFMRPNSPNYYCRYYVRQEQKYYQKSLRTKSKVVAQEKAKEIYREITALVSRDEKVFNLTWRDAIDIYDEMEMERYMGGVIVREWYKKKLSYLRNTWMDFVGADTPVNKTNDDDAREFYRQRSRQLKTKGSLRREMTLINAIYTDLLVPKNYCLRKLHMPKTTITKRDRSRRTDTFTIEEWEVLYNSMRRWTERDEITDERQAQTRYGKTTNKVKILTSSQQELEWCRRNILREFILISANMGTRPVSELLNVKRKDVTITKTKFKNWYADGNDEWKLTCDLFIDSRKTGERMVNGIAGRFFNRLMEFYESQGITLGPDDYMFIDLLGRRKGQQIDRFVLNRLFTELMHYAGLTRIKFTPYHLRHFYITQRLMNGVDVVLLSENAGNSPQVLLQTYSHIKTKLATQELNKQRKRSSQEEIGIDF